MFLVCVLKSRSGEIPGVWKLIIQNLCSAFFANTTLDVSSTAFLVPELLKFPYTVIILQLDLFYWDLHWDLRNIIWLLSISTFCKKKMCSESAGSVLFLIASGSTASRGGTVLKEHQGHWVSWNWDTQFPSSWINLSLAAWGILDVSTSLLGCPLLLDFSSMYRSRCKGGLIRSSLLKRPPIHSSPVQGDAHLPVGAVPAKAPAWCLCLLFARVGKSLS